jgi:hypothetical protein
MSEREERADIDAEFTTEERDRLIDKVANGVVKRRMEAPAVMFLELHKPLSFIGSQALIVGSPFVGPFVGIENVHRVSKLIADRSNVERLIQRIEELSMVRKAAREG